MQWNKKEETDVILRSGVSKISGATSKASIQLFKCSGIKRKRQMSF